VIHFVTDVTERKQAEETLRKSVEPFRRLVQSMDEIIFSLEQGQK
jgi:PAS domain-containing protein